MQIVGQILYALLWAFTLFLLARIVIDLVQMFAPSWRPRGVILVVAETIYTVTDPPLKALRRVIPPLRLGSISFDLAFLLLFIAVHLGRELVRFVFLQP